MQKCLEVSNLIAKWLYVGSGEDSAYGIKLWMSQWKVMLIKSQLTVFPLTYHPFRSTAVLILDI